MSNEQVTIFDVVPNENQPDFRKMTEKEIMHQIEISTGIILNETGIEGVYGNKVYRAKVGEKNGVDIHLSKYVTKDREGEPFISCDMWKNKGNEGRCQGCDSIEQVVDLIREYLLK